VVDRAGVFAHPTAKGSRPGGWKEPFAPLSSSEHDCRSSREAPTGLRDAPSRPRVSAAPGERAMAPSRSTRRATSCSVLFQCARAEGGPSLFVSALKRPDDSSDVRLCSDGGHPGGQGSGERRSANQSRRREVPGRNRGPETPAKWAAFRADGLTSASRVRRLGHAVLDPAGAAGERGAAADPAEEAADQPRARRLR
jgi:hypothetical protein